MRISGNLSNPESGKFLGVDFRNPGFWKLRNLKESVIPRTIGAATPVPLTLRQRHHTHRVYLIFFVYFCFLLPRRLLFALSRTFPVLTCRLLVKCTMGRLQQLSMRVTSTCSYDVTTGSTKMFSGCLRDLTWRQISIFKLVKLFKEWRLAASL